VNWLLSRYLCAALSGDARGGRKTNEAAPEAQELRDLSLGVGNAKESEEGADDDIALVLVSWMRDWEFWRMEARRAGGIDLAQLSQKGRFAFVDGLTGIHLTTAVGTKKETPLMREAPALGTGTTGRRPIPLRQPPGSSQPSKLPSAREQLSESQAVQTPKPNPTNPRLFKLTSSELPHTLSTIEEAIASLTSSTTTKRKILLILDTPSILLSLQHPANSTSPQPPTTLRSLILALRLNSHIHSIILSLPADLCAPPSDLPQGYIPSPLENESLGFLVGIAHTADLLLGVRGLETGGAGDVGGVLRITKGSGGWDEEVEGSEKREWREQELLYFVGNDGGVRVWERGAGIG